MPESVDKETIKELVRRLDAENERQNRRLQVIENNMEKLNALQVSISKIELNVETLLNGQKRQNERLGNLEGKDGNNWRKTVEYVLFAVLGAVVLYFLRMGGISA